MLHIQTYLGKSAIHGTGVFCAHDIGKGELIWSFCEGFDLRYTPEEYQRLPITVQKFIDAYGFHCLADGDYYLTADHDRFTNHCETPNTIVREDDRTYAARDIKAGEEITTDYRSFDLSTPQKLGLEA